MTQHSPSHGVTAALIQRDLEAGLDVSSLLLWDLAYSIRYDPIPNGPGFIFQVPEELVDADSKLQIRILGRQGGIETELSGQIFGVSDSLSRWKAGNYYRFPCQAEDYDELRMEISLPLPEDQWMRVELAVDLLSLATENTTELAFRAS